jgi:hypothetical protein
VPSPTTHGSDDRIKFAMVFFLYTTAGKRRRVALVLRKHRESGGPGGFADSVRAIGRPWLKWGLWPVVGVAPPAGSGEWIDGTLAALV